MANRVYDDEAREWIISDFKAGIVDGKIIKEDTWYTVKNGEFVEVEE